MINNVIDKGVMTREEYDKARQLALGETKKPLWIQASDIEPKEAHFLRAGIPANNLTIIAGDGGVGKSLLECNLAAAISMGTVSMLDPEPQSYADIHCTDPARVLLLNAEDSFAHVISKRLTDAGADMDMITTVNPDADERIMIDGELIKAIRTIEPKLVIIDPLQSFIPKGIAMERRNDMRQMLAPLQKCAEEINVAICVIMHTNKRQAASGRDRLADSADIWDIARSVFIMGNCNDEDHTRYISHEKSSYCEPIPTTLCRIDRTGLYKIGETDRKDYDFIHERDRHGGGRPPMQRDAAEQFITDAIRKSGGEMSGQQLSLLAEQNDIRQSTFAAARANLTKAGLLTVTHSGRRSHHITMYKLKE